MDDISRIGLGDQVASLLRRRIVSGELMPGEHLVESALSAEFAVSRGPVRDALRDLEAEGLVQPARQGVRVVGLTPDDITELYSLREAIEVLAVRMCIERADPALWAHFEGPLSRMLAAADRADAAAFAVADLEFHTLFYELCGHRRLLSVWRHYEPTFKVLFEVTTREDADLHPVVDDHRAVIEPGRAGDVAATTAELRAHLLGASNRLRNAHARALETRRRGAVAASGGR